MATEPAALRRGAVTADPEKQQPKELYPMSNWKYDAFLWAMSVLADLFFREVHPRGSWRVPRKGPILFVAAPHANQFVDALILQRTLRNEARRRVSLLIAEKSVHGFIGWASRQVGSVPVGRAQDAARPAHGVVYLPDPVNDPTLIRGVGTKFETQAEVGGMIFLPSVKGQSGSSVDIARIVSDEEVRVKRPFKGKVPLQQLTGRGDVDEQGNLTDKSIVGPREGYAGTKYKLAPHIDQTKVYQAVFDRLRSGGCVGIFPEGGSHDRTELLPLKAGVAIMALGALAENPDCGLRIVPVGMNYFHPHKFRSRAVIEFGSPFEIPRDLVDKYQNNQRRDAIGQTLDMCYQALNAVTVSSPDYDTLLMIQAARRLYNTGKKLPLPLVVELNRRLALGFSKYKDDPRIIDLISNVKEYNKQLRYLNIRDHQVAYARMSVPKVVFTLLYRVAKLLVLSVGVLPGLVLFSPVFVAAKIISIRKARTALAGSSVKIKGRDVMATWKLMVALAFAPVLYNFYSLVIALKVYQDRLWGRVPAAVPLWAVFLAGWLVFPAVTFAALRFGEVGMDIAKSLRPLVLCIASSGSGSGYNNIQRLRDRRADLSRQVVDVINELGPDMYDDFERTRLVADPTRDEGAVVTTPAPGVSGRRRGGGVFSAGTGSEPPSPGPGSAGPLSSSGASSPGLATLAGPSRRNTTQSSRAIPRNESFSDIGHVALFATRPPSRSSAHSRSRSRSSSVGGGTGSPSPFGGGGFPVQGFTSLDSPEGFDEASRRIREAMVERGQEIRRRKSGGGKMGMLGLSRAEDGEAEGDVEPDGDAEAGTDGNGVGDGNGYGGDGSFSSGMDEAGVWEEAKKRA